MAVGELAPVESEVNDQQRGKGESDDADGGESVAEVAPVTRPQVEHPARDKSKRDGVGAGHPLTVHRNLAVACSDESGGGAYHPGGGLHRGSWKTRAARRESDPREGTNEDREDVDTAEDAVELEVTPADARGEIDGTDQKSEGPGERMRDEQMSVGDDL